MPEGRFADVVLGDEGFQGIGNAIQGEALPDAGEFLDFIEEQADFGLGRSGLTG